MRRIKFHKRRPGSDMAWLKSQGCAKPCPSQIVFAELTCQHTDTISNVRVFRFLRCDVMQIRKLTFDNSDLLHETQLLG